MNKAAATPDCPPRLFGRFWLVQLLHLTVLLLPTLVLSNQHGVTGWVACFAATMLAAAVLESRAVAGAGQPSAAPINDIAAVRVARFVGISLLMILWLAQIESWAGGPRAALLHLSGLLCLCCGIVLRVLAIRTLGEHFVTDIRGGSQIVRHGIYAWLRHPSEIGLLLIASGGPLLLGAPMTAGLAALLLVPVSLWRMRRENAFLATFS